MMSVQRGEVIPKIRKLSGDDKYARYEIAPLTAGMGTTIGNALRRTLLNEITGAAVTFIKIDGVLHEYTTIPGVREDVMEIILNIKDLAIKVTHMADISRPQKASISVHGRGEITGADIKMPVGYDIVNPELHIAELTDEKARLSMELTIEVGKGYAPADRVDRSKLEIGLIPVDAIFAPIKRVNFVVEPTRVGAVGGYERLVLEIWSNGAVEIDRAIVEAADLIIDHFKLFLGLLLERSITTIGLDKKVASSLEQHGIKTLGDLISKTEDELLKIKGFGKQALSDVTRVLSIFGLKLGKEK